MDLSASSSGISGVDIINLFAAAASIVLAVVALVLAIFFFVQSKNEADRSSRNAAEISAGVARLEKLFNTLYADTFSMMRETVTDMRKHIWKVAPGSEIAGKEQASESQTEVLIELDRISRNVGLTDANIGQLREEISPVLRDALERQRRADEKPRETFMDRILRAVKERPRTVQDLMYLLGASEEELVDIVFYLEGYLKVLS